MKHWLKNASIQKKMMASYAVLFAVSLIAFIILFFFDLKSDIQSEISHMEQMNDQLGLDLDNMIDRMGGLYHFHLSDTKVRNLILYDDSDIDPEGYNETKEKLVNSLSLLSDMESYVLRATLLTEDGRVFKNLEEDQTDYISQMNQLAESNNWERGGGPYFCELREEKINLVNYRVISIIAPLWDVAEPEPAGYIFLDLDYEKFLSQWEQTAEIARETEFMVLSPENILFDSDAGNSEERIRDTEEAELRSSNAKSGIYMIHGKHCVAAVQDYEISGWRFIQYVPMSYFSRGILTGMGVFILILIVVIIVTVAGGYGFSKRVSYPVRVLSETMGQVALENADEEQEIPLFEALDVNREDEIGKIIQSYNAMAKRINDNIIKTYTYKLRQKQAELKMLQFQINPHFLYNALNTISAIAKLENVNYIPEIASNLSDMFRYNISERDIVTIQEELDHTLNYMNIQMIRFPNCFQIKVEIEEELRKCRILKFILQPIVENSYKYGFKRRKKQNIIHIKAHRQCDNVIISIEDNGIGIDPEKLVALNESLASGEKIGGNSGIGLHNVNFRLRNYYGDAYGIYLESEPESFTRVSLMIRYEAEMCEEEEHDKDNSGGR